MRDMEATTSRSLNEGEAGRYEPRAQSVRDLFELLAFHGLIIGISVAIAGVALEAASWISLPVNSKAGMIVGAVIVLAAAIGINWHFDSPRGKGREKTLKRWARTYAYPMVLAVGVYAGWQWRHHNQPDPNQQQAYETAAKTCAQIPLCLQQAERAAGGADLGQYLRPSRSSAR